MLSVPQMVNPYLDSQSLHEDGPSETEVLFTNKLHRAYPVNHINSLCFPILMDLHELPDPSHPYVQEVRERWGRRGRPKAIWSLSLSPLWFSTKRQHSTASCLEWQTLWPTTAIIHHPPMLPPEGEKRPRRDPGIQLDAPELHLTCATTLTLCHPGRWGICRTAWCPSTPSASALCHSLLGTSHLDWDIFPALIWMSPSSQNTGCAIQVSTCDQNDLLSPLVCI